MVIPDRRFVSFMWSYPNLIPLPAAEVERIAAALEPWPFEPDPRRVVEPARAARRQRGRAPLGRRYAASASNSLA